MHGEELVIWSAACGGIAVVTLLALGEAVRLRNWAGWRNFLWLFVTFHLVLVLSGLTPFLYPALSAEDRLAIDRFLGPLWFSLCAFLVRFMEPQWRTGRIVNLCVWAVVASGPALAMAAWLIDDHTMLANAAPTVTLVGILVMSVLAAWAGLRGSVESWGLAVAGFVAAPALASLYSQHEGHAPSTATQALSALFIVLSTLVVGALVRPSGLHHHSAKLKLQPSPDRDPLTRLYNSAGIVRKLLQAQKRQRWFGGYSALLLVHLSDTEQWVRRHSQLALDALLVSIAARIQLVVGHNNPVGRYGADCFVILLENAQSASGLDSFSATLRQVMAEPVQVHHTGTDSEAIRPRFGLGGVRLTPRNSVDALLFKAQELAQSDPYRT